jgi:hypothetical protein
MGNTLTMVNAEERDQLKMMSFSYIYKQAYDTTGLLPIG